MLALGQHSICFRHYAPLPSGVCGRLAPPTHTWVVPSRSVEFLFSLFVIHPLATSKYVPGLLPSLFSVCLPGRLASAPTVAAVPWSFWTPTSAPAAQRREFVLQQASARYSVRGKSFAHVSFLSSECGVLTSDRWQTQYWEGAKHRKKT